MAKSVDEIVKMNLKVGEIIEIKVQPNDDEESYTALGYFIGINSEKKYLEYSNVLGTIDGKKSFWMREAIIDQIEDIKKLQYQK